MIFINFLNGLIILKVICYLFYFRKRDTLVSAADGINVQQNNLTVDIIVPAYNEEKVILLTLESLSKIKYSNVNFIIVDDGSQDGTLKLVKDFCTRNAQFKVLSQQKRGKAAALNAGLQVSCSDIVVCLDADTTVGPDMVEKIVPYFNNPGVAAVAGTIKVKNQQSMLGKMQAVEYTVLYNYEREIFESFNGILIIPGALGAFRRNVLDKLGGYCNDTLTEDTDLTFKLLYNKYVVCNAQDVVGYTEVPASATMFLRQRIRWKVGVFQVLYKYQAYTLSSLSKTVSLLIIPYTWLYSLILPIFTSFADIYFFTISVLSNSGFLIPCYLFFILFDVLICYVVLLKKRIRYHNLLGFLIQRFVLRQLTFLTYCKIFIKAVNGNLFEWGRSVRYGANETNQHL